MHELKHDIEKYLRGELSPAEMHALEKRALDDPFLADALEGAGQIDAKEFSSDIKNLRESLSSRVDQKKVIPLWIWPARIAAGLLLIAVSAYIVINLLPEKNASAPIASNNNKESASELQASRDSVVVDTAKTSNKDGFLSMAEPKEQSLPAPVTSKPRTANSPVTKTEAEKKSERETELVAKSPVESKAEEVTSGNLALADVVEDQAKVAPPVIQPQAEKSEVREELAQRAKRKADSQPAAAGASVSKDADDARRSGFVQITAKKVSGRVISSDDGSGLPGVNVVIKGTSTGTVTDINGNYKIELDDPKSTLVYSFIGLESTEVPVVNDSSLNVSMNQDVAQLSEVVVTGYGESKNEDEKVYTTFEMAEPAGGRKAFKKYLEARLTYPQQALDNEIEGKVTIQFTVETSGQLSNFNVVKGIGYGCDDEVIRLIKEGPKWAPSKRNEEPVKGRVRVRMRFALPKKK